MGCAPVSSLLQQMGPLALSWIAFSFFWPRGVAQFGQFGSYQRNGMRGSSWSRRVNWSPDQDHCVANAYF